jgi:hypothetical protein
MRVGGRLVRAKADSRRDEALVRRAVRAVAALALLSATASAQEMVGGYNPSFGENPPRDYQSSQWFALEIKFGGYSPDIDSSPGLKGQTPFADLFNPQGTKGRPPWRLLSSLEFDYQFFHRFGSLGIGHSVGFYRRTTHGFVFPLDANGKPVLDAKGQPIGCTVPNCVRSGDETGLNIIPLELMAVYRFDVLSLRYHVPLVPYVKLGLAYYLWWINNGNGFLSAAQFQPARPDGQPTGQSPTTLKQQGLPPDPAKQSGYGGTLGWVFNPGIALVLDVLDPTAARTLDTELGINHTYLFCEMHYADISGFGASDKLVLSDLSLNAGLAFEF